jgi:hypothetical protein
MARLARHASRSDVNNGIMIDGQKWIAGEGFCMCVGFWTLYAIGASINALWGQSRGD